MKTIVITGASSGIGKASAKFFAAKGWNVAATMRHPESERELSELPNVKCYELDVTDSATITSAYDTILGDFGKVDALFNNAGYCLFGPLELSDEEQIRNAYDTLIIGLTLVTKKFIPHMRKNRDGVIISTSSVGGLLTLPLTSTYHEAKYAVEGLMEGLSYELYPFNVYCKLVEPGGIQTDFWNRSLVMADGIDESDYGKQAAGYLNQMAQPVSDSRASADDVAAVVYEAVTDGEKKWRYTVACDDFIAFRRSMNDEEWIAHIGQMYSGFGV
ncbi:SDR family oxidoreductase [Lederbergia citri]|uniref:SDR family oxidoreductase n=1 Tax=Lederbergia citri TaxID=2833580 RepID=A0A942YL11_9BACI|nr:SDR family oxidoreductase [Lederbergia citri]MBS4197901.1 SDR family oxidoreductase [Lederbergia citri]